MCKQLEEMSLEELWELFPVVLTDHRDCWADWYREEAALLAAILPADVRLHHIGSTAVPGIQAKPIIDILAEVPAEYDLDSLIPLLAGSQYICMNRSSARISFNKGYTPQGYMERVFHLHAVPAGRISEVYFRDYLREHRKAAKAYEVLKQQLAEKYSHNRDAYTDAKTEFVNNVLSRIPFGIKVQGEQKHDIWNA